MKKLLLVFLLVCNLAAKAFAPFTIRDIRVDGLQRVSVGTVFNYFPLKRGDLVDPEILAQATRDLYSSGLFKDVTIEQNANVLVLRLLERPAINSLEFKGNREIKTVDLKKGFRQIGLAPGRVLNNSALDKAAQELERQYIALGFYGTKVKPRIVPLERNRAAVVVNVYEGGAARVRHVRFVGNRSYSDKTLINLLEMKPGKWYKFFSKSDKFSNEKLKADIETIISFYMDRGFVDFSIDASQVSISPDKKDITINYNINEGNRFYVRKQILDGSTRLPRRFLKTATAIKNGEVFSQKKLVAAREAISEKLGAQGYAFSEVKIVPQKVSLKHVDLVYQINPGKRTYVNRIHITGNTRTQDEVIRRELRLFEGGRFSGEELKRSTERLRRLGYFEEVNVETSKIEGSEDKINVNYSVVEKSTGSINLGLGYSQSGGIGLTFGISQDNFLGTGKRFALNLSTSKSRQLYSLNIRDPYFTRHGVSLGYGLFYSKRDTEDLEIASYVIDEFGGEFSFGIPINEYDRISIGAKLSRAEIICGTTFQECTDYISEYGSSFTTKSNGNTQANFDLADLFLNWSRDSRDRAIFPTSGSKQVLSLLFGVGDAKYNRFKYISNNYFLVSENVTLRLKADLGYGVSRGGSSKHLPFFKKFYAGGVSSVRGFEESTLSPSSINDSDRFLGGNLKTVFNAEIITPMPFFLDNKAVRMVSFVDAGYAFGLKDDFDADDLRISAGIGMKWLSPMGPLVFSLAKPIKSQDGDKEQTFQFQLGGDF